MNSLRHFAGYPYILQRERVKMSKFWPRLTTPAGRRFQLCPCRKLKQLILNRKQTLHMYINTSRKCKTRNLSGDEIANVNFLYDDIVHVLQNTTDSCINSATDRRGYVLERMFAKFCEITQYNDHHVVQGHSRSPILVPIESSYTTS